MARRLWKTLAMIVILAAGLAAERSRAQENIESLTAVCAGCHGEGGVSSNPMVPTLAGQPYTLIEDNLLAFRAGGRSCAPGRDDGSAAAKLAQTMCMTVAGLSEDQIESLAEYYESRDFVPAEQTYDHALAGRGAGVHAESGCERCHSDGGRTTNAMAPVLAGQWKPYLRRAMGALRTGARHGPAEMNAAISGLSDEEVEALLHYYASVPSGPPAQARP